MDILDGTTAWDGGTLDGKSKAGVDVVFARDRSGEALDEAIGADVQPTFVEDCSKETLGMGADFVEERPPGVRVPETPFALGCTPPRPRLKPFTPGGSDRRFLVCGGSDRDGDARDLGIAGVDEGEIGDADRANGESDRANGESDRSESSPDGDSASESLFLGGVGKRISACEQDIS